VIWQGQTIKRAPGASQNIPPAEFRRNLLTFFSGRAQTTLLDRQQRNIRYFMGRLQPDAADDGGSGNEYMIVKELYRQRIFFPPPVRNFVPGQIVACPQKAL